MPTWMEGLQESHRSHATSVWESNQKSSMEEADSTCGPDADAGVPAGACKEDPLWADCYASDRISVLPACQMTSLAYEALSAMLCY